MYVREGRPAFARPCEGVHRRTSRSCFSSSVLQFYVKQFSVNIVSMSKSVLFQIIQFSISKQFKFKYGLLVKNIILSYSV